MTNDRQLRTTTGRTATGSGLSRALADLARQLSGPTRLVPMRVAAAYPPRRIRPVRSWDRLTRS